MLKFAFSIHQTIFPGLEGLPLPPAPVGMCWTIAELGSLCASPSGPSLEKLQHCKVFHGCTLQQNISVKKCMSYPGQSTDVRI